MYQESDAERRYVKVRVRVTEKRRAKICHRKRRDTKRITHSIPAPVRVQPARSVYPPAVRYKYRNGTRACRACVSFRVFSRSVFDRSVIWNIGYRNCNPREKPQRDVDTRTAIKIFFSSLLRNPENRRYRCTGGGNRLPDNVRDLHF